MKQRFPIYIDFVKAFQANPTLPNARRLYYYAVGHPMWRGQLSVTGHQAIEKAHAMIKEAGDNEEDWT